MHQGQTSGNFCIFVPHDIPIISQKNAHVHSKEAHSKNFTSTTTKKRAHVVRVVLMQRAGDRPRAKALGRNWRRPFGAFPCWVYKKESGFGLLVSRRSRQRNSRCRPKRNLKKVTKTRPDVTDRKASPDAPDFFVVDLFLVESTRTQPEATDRHRQSPLRAHSNTPKKWPFRRRGWQGGNPPPVY